MIIGLCLVLFCMAWVVRCARVIGLFGDLVEDGVLGAVFGGHGCWLVGGVTQSLDLMLELSSL